MAVTSAELLRGINELGVAGAPVCVHSSLRSLGAVEGGAEAVVGAFRAAGCTLVAPTFTYMCMAPPPAHDRPPRNGVDYDEASDLTPEPFDPATSGVSPEMGVLPATLVRDPASVRGDHPICSFAALGPQAALVLAHQRADDVYAPLREVAAADGFVLLVGVELTSLTLLHLAEKDAGRVLFRRWGARTGHGVVASEVGGCSGGFGALEPVLAPLVRETRVGPSRWRAYPARAALDTAAVWIRAHPERTRCNQDACARCEDAIAGGPLL